MTSFRAIATIAGILLALMAVSGGVSGREQRSPVQACAQQTIVGNEIHWRNNCSFTVEVDIELKCNGRMYWGYTVRITPNGAQVSAQRTSDCRVMQGNSAEAAVKGQWRIEIVADTPSVQRTPQRAAPELGWKECRSPYG